MDHDWLHHLLLIIAWPIVTSLRSEVTKVLSDGLGLDKVASFLLTGWVHRQAKVNAKLVLLLNVVVVKYCI